MKKIHSKTPGFSGKPSKKEEIVLEANIHIT